MSNENPCTKFIGEMVNVLETTKEYKGQPFVVCLIDDTDPVVLAMKEAAKGYTLRIMLPEMAISCEFRSDRINVNIEKKDGNYYIESVSFG